jgi:hypothetical protein
MADETAQVVLSDMVVCWRVYVVFGRNKRVLVMAVFLLIVLACTSPL